MNSADASRIISELITKAQKDGAINDKPKPVLDMLITMFGACYNRQLRRSINGGILDIVPIIVS